MSAGDSWSQPNQQVVRDGEPVGTPNTDGQPDPQSGGKRRRGGSSAGAAPGAAGPEGGGPGAGAGESKDAGKGEPA